MMKQHLSRLLCILLLLAAIPAYAVSLAGIAGDVRERRPEMNCDSRPAWCESGEGTCSPEKRGRCGKRRGDWYGARQPVADAAEARRLLVNYFSGQDYRVSDVTEKKWGFRAEILDKSGKVIDRVMIDKRSGRIRSLN